MSSVGTGVLAIGAAGTGAAVAWVAAGTAEKHSIDGGGCSPRGRTSQEHHVIGLKLTRGGLRLQLSY
jgi:hypothetical protein